ncbi:MAG: hypothetical protein H0U74_01115 [Bradymonadaceae bacterium]|nr:hypothetical protein [Lujinxingiaceae bacterium]
MFAPSRRKQRRVLPYRVAFWLTMALIATVMYLQRSPIGLDGDPQSSEGLEITREASADVLVVLDYKAIRASGESFETRDWSAVWINIIEQEVGPVTIATPQSLSQQSLSAARVVILTASVANQINDALLPTLRQWVLDGNLLVVDQPEGRLREAFSANGRAGSRRGQQITFARDLPNPFHAQLQEMPLSTSYVGSTAARNDATTLLAIDGAPAIYAATIGTGTVVTIDFNLGEQLVALQQGKPTARFAVKAAARPESSTPSTEDLVLDERLRGASVPYADLLERFIVYGVLMRYAPLPAFWQFPNGAKGAVILVHEDSQLGDGGGWMLEHETTFGAVSTLLTTVDAGLTSEGAAQINKRGGEVGLLWRLASSPAEVREPVGMGRFKPVARPIDLATQLKALKATLPVDFVRSTRTLDGWWSESWSGPFETMAANGIRIDTSYGLRSTSGFAFGTGLPFLAFDSRGMPLGVREMPVIVPAQAIAGPSLEELLRISAEGHHQALTVSMDPALFADFPDAERFEKWLAMFQSVQDAEHVMTSALRFDTYQRNRRAGSIRSRLVERAPLPENARSSATAPNHQGTVLRISAEAKARNMFIVVPQNLGERRFLIARQGAKRVQGELLSTAAVTEPASIVGFELRRIALEQGFNTIDIYYH